MKRLALALAPAMLALSACSSEPVSSGLSDEEMFVIHVRSTDIPMLTEATDADLISLGYRMCSLLDNGDTVRGIMDGARDQFAGEQQAMELTAAILAGAVVDLCPEYNGEL